MTPVKLTDEQIHTMCKYLRADCHKCPAEIDTAYGRGQQGCHAIAEETLLKARDILGAFQRTELEQAREAPMSEGKVLTPEQLAEIRERDNRNFDQTSYGLCAAAYEDRRPLLSHIDRVSAERDALRTCYDGLLETGNKILAERDAAVAQAEQMRGDAERYRWLRAGGVGTGLYVADAGAEWRIVCDANLDERIDTALKEQP